MKLHGLCLLNRFGVNFPYRKHDFSDFFAYIEIAGFFWKSATSLLLKTAVEYGFYYTIGDLFCCCTNLLIRLTFLFWSGIINLPTPLFLYYTFSYDALHSEFTAGSCKRKTACRLEPLAGKKSVLYTGYRGFQVYALLALYRDEAHV